MNKKLIYADIIFEAYDFLNKNKPFVKKSQKLDNNNFINYMPIQIENELFNKTVLRTNTGMISQYSLFNIEKGIVTDTFVDNNLSSIRTAYTALWCFEKFIEKNNFETISIIGARGSIGKLISRYIINNYPDKEIFLVDNESELNKKIVEMDIIFSAPKYLKDVISSKEVIRKNKLVLPIHSRGWHNNLDECFDNILVDVPSQAPWISKKAKQIDPNFMFLKPGNYIVYNTGHVIFDYLFYKKGFHEI